MFDQPLSLTELEVHLWYFQSDCLLSDEMQEMMRFLDAQEYQRYERFLSPIKRHQFVIGRSLLKQVLACYLGEPAEKVQLLYTAQQKPFLEGNLAFNISHSGQHVLIAVARHAIGVDIQEEEVVQGGQVYQGLSVQERQKVRRDALFQYWVLKEALWKADNQQTDPACLLDAMAGYQAQEHGPFSFLMDSWCAGYISPFQQLHMGWVVKYPNPIWRLNGRILDIKMIDNFAVLSEMK